MSDTPDRRPDDEPDPFAGLPPEVADLLRGLTGGAGGPDLAELLGGLGLENVPPQMMALAMEQVRAMMEPGDDASPVDAERATVTARAVAAADGDPVVGPHARARVEDAVRLAQLWLDDVTAFSGTSLVARAWSRAEWVEATMPTWVGLVAPVAEGVTGAIAGAMRAQLGQLGDAGLPEGLLPPGIDLSAMAGSVEPMMRRMSGAMFSLQSGQAVGHLATETLTGTEVGLPLLPGHEVALLPTNVAAFTEGLEVPEDEVRLHLAVRESARARLFGAVPWLGSALVAAVRDYARDLRVDTEGIEAAVAGMDVSDPEELQRALREKLFTPTPSPAQQAALSRLETLLALVEGWVEHVTARATERTLPHGAALSETLRRRRASGGPAERTFATLVGLELRPRRLRDAANLFAALEDRLGADGRDAAWRVPDLAPTSADLDDVLGYVDRAAEGPRADEMDAALEELLRGE